MARSPALIAFGGDSAVELLSASTLSGGTIRKSCGGNRSGAVVHAEIKAIASNDPAVMEKVCVDTEIRKLDQLRSSHVNLQHNIRWQVRCLPEPIQRSNDIAKRLAQDIATRDGNTPEDFSMTIGRHSYSGKGAREEAANALKEVVLPWRNDESTQ